MKIVIADGAGGIMIGMAFVDIFLKRYISFVEVNLICSNEVFELVNSLYPPRIGLIYYHHNKDTDEESLCQTLKDQRDGHVYSLTPDKCHRSKWRLPLEDHGLTWQLVKEHKFLANKFSTGKCKQIFLGFQSGQDNIYPYLTELICNLCEKMPDYKFNFIGLKKWSDCEKIEYGISKQDVLVYSNFNWIEPTNIVDDFNWILKNHDTIICTDNGLSNIAYYAGKTRHLIDMRYDSPAMYLRWRQSMTEIIPGNISAHLISETVKLCAEHPVLTGIPRMHLIEIPKRLLQNMLMTEENYAL